MKNKEYIGKYKKYKICGQEGNYFVSWGNISDLKLRYIIGTKNNTKIWKTLKGAESFILKQLNK